MAAETNGNGGQAPDSEDIQRPTEQSSHTDTEPGSVGRRQQLVDTFSRWYQGLKREKSVEPSSENSGMPYEDQINEAAVLTDQALDIPGIHPKSREYFIKDLRSIAISLEKDPLRDQKLADLMDIAAHGRLDGHEMIPYWEIPGTNGPAKTAELLYYRQSLLKIYNHNPELAKAIVADRIVGGEGTTSASLLGVAKIGIRPHAVAAEDLGFIVSGEGIAQDAYSGMQEDYVYFAQWYNVDSLNNYSTKDALEISEEGLTRTVEKYKVAVAGLDKESTNPDTQYMRDKITQQIHYLTNAKAFLEKSDKTSEELLQARLMRENFPLIYLVEDPGKQPPDVGTPSGRNIRGEYYVRGGTESEKIKIVLVPKERISEVQGIVAEQGRNWQVFPIEDFSSK